MAIVCLIFGWAHIGLHALGEAGAGHDHFALQKHRVADGHDHSAPDHDHSAHASPDFRTLAEADHEGPNHNGNDAAYGEQCLLADHPPTTLCPGPDGSGRFDTARARQPLPDNVKNVANSSVFPIRAPPSA